MIGLTVTPLYTVGMERERERVILAAYSGQYEGNAQPSPGKIRATHRHATLTVSAGCPVSGVLLTIHGQIQLQKYQVQ